MRLTRFAAWLVFVASALGGTAAFAQVTTPGVNLLGAGTQPPAGNVSQGQTNYAVMGFGLQTTGAVPGLVTLMGVTISTNAAHTAQASDIAAVKIARDANLNGQIDSGEVIQSIASISFPMTFNAFSALQQIPPSPQFSLYIVGVDVTAGAQAGRIISLRISQNTDVATNPVLTVTGAPVVGNNQTIVAPSGSEMDLQRPAGTSKASGSTDNLGNVTVATPTNFVYTIRNEATATGNLQLTGTPAVDIPVITLLNCSATVTVQPSPTTIAAGNSVTFTVQVTPSATGAFSFFMTIPNNDSNENPYNLNVQGTGVAGPVPTISLSTNSLNLGSTTQGTAGTPATYTVSGSNLTANIAIAAPTGVEISSTASTGPYSSSLTLTQSGGSVPTTTIYARIAASASVGPLSGNISHSSTGAATQNISVSGTVNAATPEMDVSRGASPVADGATDSLGTVPSGAAQTVTYTIANSGTSTLNLTGTTLVVVTPVMNVTSATVTTPPANTVAPAGTTTFVVTYTVTAAGAFSFTISIDNNDANENPYNWTVSGTGATSVPELDVSRGATAVLTGSTDNIGSKPAGSASPVSYTLANSGTATLNISAAGATAGTNCTVSVTTGAPPTISAGSTAPFVISVTPLAAGAFDFTVTILNDDPNEATYTFTVTGTATTSGGGGGGGGGGGSGGGCSADGRSGWLILAASLAALVLALRTRTRANC